jgi:hypothetical protein
MTSGWGARENDSESFRTDHGCDPSLRRHEPHARRVECAIWPATLQTFVSDREGLYRRNSAVYF